MKRLFLSTTLVLASLAVHAAPKFYAEAGYTFADYEESDTGNVIKSSPKAVRLLGGAELNHNVAVELMLGFNGGDDAVTANGVRYSQLHMQVDSVYGVYVKPKAEIAPNFEVFGRVGYSRVEATVNASGYGSSKGKDNDLSYGVGAAYRFTPQVYLSVDYMSYLNKSDYSVKGFTAGLGYKF